MPQRVPNAAPPTRARFWPPLIVIGVLAIGAGGVLPKLLPDDVPATQPRARDGAASTGDLHYTPPELPEVPSTHTLFLRLGGMTILVLAVGVGVLVCGRHWLRGLAPQAPAGGKLCLLETLSLGNRCSLHLVQLASRQVLVGADASGIKSVVTLPDDFEQCLRDDEPNPRPPGDDHA